MDPTYVELEYKPECSICTICYECPFWTHVSMTFLATISWHE